MKYFSVAMNVNRSQFTINGKLAKIQHFDLVDSLCREISDLNQVLRHVNIAFTNWVKKETNPQQTIENLKRLAPALSQYKERVRDAAGLFVSDYSVQLDFSEVDKVIEKVQFLISD